MNKKALLLLMVSAVTALVACTGNQSSTSSTSESSASTSSVTSSTTSESTSSSSTSSKVEEKKEFTIDGVTYKQLEDDDFLTVTKIAPEERTEINVLPEVEGKTVKALWPNLTFAPNSTVKKIVLPDTITTIGDSPFRSYQAVEELVVPFIGSSKDDKESVSRIAHKMIPLFSMLGAEKLVPDLRILELEASEMELGKWKELVDDIINRIKTILNEVENKITES